MGRPALILAALAADAAPGISFLRMKKIDLSNNLDSLRLIDSDGVGYVFKIPTKPAGESEVASERAVLSALKGSSHLLPFDIASELGQSRDSDGTQGYLFTSVEGEDPEPSKLPPGVFSKSLADALVAIHSLNLDVVRSAGLPEFDATAVLHQKVSELDKIAATGRVPAALLSRWESALEDVGLFRFHSTVIHGGLNREAIRLSGQRVAGITAMESMRIADPAEDLTWILGACLPSTVEDILLHYRASRPAADENLLQRATLYSELELGSWLAYCMERSDEEGVAQAEALIAELRDQQEAGSLRDLRATSFAGLAAGTAMLPTITESIPLVSDATESLTQVQEESQLDAQDFEGDAETSIDELFAQEGESEDRPASSDELF